MCSSGGLGSDASLAARAVATESVRLWSVPDGRSQELQNTLEMLCERMNDPDRASRLLRNSHIAKRIFIAAPDHVRENLELCELARNTYAGAASQQAALDAASTHPAVSATAADDMLCLASTAQALVVHSIAPGRGSYSIFVEAEPNAKFGDSAYGPNTTELPDGPHGNQLDPGGNETQRHQDHQHQVRLFLAALAGILALPQPPGLGRPTFAAIPGHAAPAMLRALREAGYDRVWDELCFRYSTSTAPGSGAERPSLPYVLDTLRSEADVQLVNSHWSYRSPYSVPLVRLLVAHSNTVCVRLPHQARQQQGEDQPPAAAATAAAAAAAAAAGATRVELSAPAATIAAATAAAEEAAEAAAGPRAAAEPANLEGGAGDESGPHSGSGSDAVAWILQYADGSMGMAHTLEAHRRRGLMRLCVEDTVRRVLGTARGGGGSLRQREVYVHIVHENAASISLFERLGFRCCPVAYHWFGVEGGGDGDVEAADDLGD